MHMIDGTTCLMEVEQLIREYTQMLGRDLSFQKLEEELRDLLRKYSGTEGRLLAAVADDGCVSGCVAYHRLSKECCEMKRLYVKPSYQGQGIGQKLVETLLLLAKDDGYSCMVLDTIEPLQSAIRLYKGLGFQDGGCDLYEEAFEIKEGCNTHHMDVNTEVFQIKKYVV